MYIFFNNGLHVIYSCPVLRFWPFINVRISMPILQDTRISSFSSCLQASLVVASQPAPHARRWGLAYINILPSICKRWQIFVSWSIPRPCPTLLRQAFGSPVLRTGGLRPLSGLSKIFLHFWEWILLMNVCLNYAYFWCGTRDLRPLAL